MSRSFSLGLVLAVSATGTAICLSVLAGWQRGGPLAERLVWVAIGVVLVVGAHLLPTLVQGTPLVVRSVAGVLWIACMATACYGHLTFFLLAQRHAGEWRAGSVIGQVALPGGRSLTAVMADRATLTTQLATANLRRCQQDCPTFEARRVTLAAKLEALDAEAADIRRFQAGEDRATARRDALTADPVTARLAALLGTTVARVDLLSGLAFAVVLEGVACVLWTVTLGSSPAVAEVMPSPAPSMTQGSKDPVSPRSKAKTSMTVDSPVASSTDPADATLAALTQDVASGLVRPTVASIRRHLSCSQARATALRRQLVARGLAA